MNKCFGLRIVHGTLNYFITASHQALPDHQTLAQAAFDCAANLDGNVAHSSPSGLTITVCRTYADVAKWVVLQDENPQEYDLGIFTTKWTPESPYPMECDYLGIKRFKVLDFAEDESEASSIVNALRNLERK